MMHVLRAEVCKFEKISRESHLISERINSLDLRPCGSLVTVRILIFHFSLVVFFGSFKFCRPGHLISMLQTVYVVSGIMTWQIGILENSGGKLKLQIYIS